VEEVEYEQLGRNLERTNQYKIFLDTVCEENEGHFDEVDRILMRFESLAEQQKEQGEMLVEFQDDIEKRRDSLGKHSKIAVTEVVEKNATIAQNRKILESIVIQRKELEAQMDKIKMRQQKGIMELGEIEMAVDNLFTRCFLMEQSGQTKAQLEQIDRVLKLPRVHKTAQMLDKLCIYYGDLEYIVKEFKNQQKQAMLKKAEEAKEANDKSPPRRGRRLSVNPEGGNPKQPDHDDRESDVQSFFE